MIENDTVFVLGAGASKPYGLPLGAELRELLCQGHEQSRLAQMLDEICGVPKNVTADFSHAFLRSGRSSIDAFLANRDDLSQVGKLAIAYELCTRERPHETCRFDNPDNWYAKLWDVMMDGVQVPGQITTNAVKFVTFNYDRSLEFFFHEAIKHSFNLDDKQAFGVWSKLGILHVYGSLGTLDAQSPSFRPYDWNVTKESLLLAAKEIKVIPESRDDDKDFQRASTWLSRATEIVFLGFGFDSLNVRRLNLAGALEWSKKQSNRTPRIWASVHGKTPAEQKAIKAHLCPDYRWIPLDHTNLGALRNSEVFG